MKTLIQEIQSSVKTEVDLNFMTQKNADRLNYYLDTFFVKKEKELIIEAVKAGLWEVETPNDLDEYCQNYYISTFGDSNEAGI